jgi:signal transduction histidine kinase
VATEQTLIDRLTHHQTLAGVPTAELVWLVSHGQLRVLEPGDVLSHKRQPVDGMHVVLDGHLSIRVDSGAGERTVMEWHGGDVTGLLPYSRLKGPPGDSVARERTEILSVPSRELQALPKECPAVTTILVHAMLDRARVFKSSELLDEKMLSLGRLSAGLAHELNNPAAAAVRGAKTLLDELSGLEKATRQFCALNLSDAQCKTVLALRDGDRSRAAWSPLELADRQEALDDWFAAEDVTGVDVGAVAASGLELADLAELRAVVGASHVEVALEYLSSFHAVRSLVGEIHAAASRISTLVSAVKGFTYMDQHAAPQPVQIGRGLSDTLTLLGYKARQNGVEMRLEAPADLPAVHGYGGELNQVWANLLDNAIDAAPGGRVRVTAAREDDRIVVSVIDNGPGIPPDVMQRIFDPFFTTKPVGQGTGLGLDIARRIVQRHKGELAASSGPSGTEFRVSLPLSA